MDVSELRGALARNGLTQIELARKLGVPPTTLSGWIRGLYPAPINLQARIEQALSLQPGTLTSSDHA